MVIERNVGNFRAFWCCENYMRSASKFCDSTTGLQNLPRVCNSLTVWKGQEQNHHIMGLGDTLLVCQSEVLSLNSKSFSRLFQIHTKFKIISHEFGLLLKSDNQF